MEKNLRQESSEVKKIVICGPESTGKSTLTKNLASHTILVSLKNLLEIFFKINGTYQIQYVQKKI